MSTMGLPGFIRGINSGSTGYWRAGGNPTSPADGLGGVVHLHASPQSYLERVRGHLDQLKRDLIPAGPQDPVQDWSKTRSNTLFGQRGRLKGTVPVSDHLDRYWLPP